MDDNLRYYIASCRLLLPFPATLDALLTTLATSLTPTSVDSLRSLDASDEATCKRWGTWEVNKWDRCEFTPAQVALLNKVRSGMKKVDEEERVDALGWTFPEHFDDEFLLSRRERQDQPFRLPQEIKSQPQSFARVLRSIQDVVVSWAPGEDVAMRKLSTMPSVDDALDVRLVATREQIDYLKQSFKDNKEAKSCVGAAESLLQPKDDDDLPSRMYRIPESPRSGSPPIFSRPSLSDAIDPLISAKDVRSILAPQAPLEEDFSSPLGQHIKMEDWNQIEHIQQFPSSPIVTLARAPPPPIWSSPVPGSTPPSTENFDMEAAIFPRRDTQIKQEEDEDDGLHQLRMDLCCAPEDEEIDQLEDDEEIDQLDSDDDEIPGLAADIAKLAPSLPPLASILDDSLDDGEKLHILLIDSRLKIPSLPTPSPSPPLFPTSLQDFSITSSTPYSLPKATGLRTLTIELGWQAWATQQGESVWDICEALDGENEVLIEGARKLKRKLRRGMEEESGVEEGGAESEVLELELVDEDEIVVARVGGLEFDEGVFEEEEKCSGGVDDQRIPVLPREPCLVAFDVPSPTEQASTTDSPAYDTTATTIEEKDRATDEDVVEPFPATQHPLMDEGSEEDLASQTRAGFDFEHVEGVDAFIYPTSSPVEMDLATQVDPCEGEGVEESFGEQEEQRARPLHESRSPEPSSTVAPHSLPVAPPPLNSAPPVIDHPAADDLSEAVPLSTWSNSVALNKFLGARGQRIAPPQPPSKVVSTPAATPESLPAPPPPRPSLPIATPAFLISCATDSVALSSYRIIASEEILQMRSHYQVLTQAGFEILDRPPRYPPLPHATLEPHLSLDGTTCVLFRRLIKLVGNAVRYDELDSNGPALARDEAIFTTLYRLSFSFDHVVLVLEESLVNSGAIQPFAYTPPVLEALAQLVLAIDELKAQGSLCVVDVVISRDPTHSAELIQQLLDYLRINFRSSLASCAFDTWDEREWLTADPTEDEFTLLQLVEVNAFSACAILCSCTVEEFVCMDESERRVRFASVCGVERIDRISSVLAGLVNRLVEVEPSSPPSTFVELEAAFVEANGGEEEEELNLSEFIVWEENE